MKRTLWKTMLVVFMILVVMTSLFGQVRRVTGRVLTIPADIETHRKANFQLGDILDIPIVSLTINNDPKPAWLLLVLELTIESSEIVGDNTATAEIVKQFAANETLTFSNKDILNFVDNVRGGTAPTSIRDAFGITDMSSLTKTFLTSGKAMPEGSYTLALKAYEIANEDASVPTGSPLKEQSVTFKVFTIGSLTIDATPRVGNRTLTFRVPETPYYSDSAISTVSTTKVTITGPGVNQSTSTNHKQVAASLDSTLKGYPSDLTDGEVSYDFSSVSFRAGEEYSFAIAYDDASGYSIASLTRTVKFASPNFSTAIDLSSPYKPEFSWNFNDDYAPWAKEYRLYLNGQYSGFTTGNSFTPSTPLVPNTTYSWYVMPINQDGTPFFKSATAKSFTTKAHTELRVDVDEPANNAVLLTGETYTFAGTPTFSDEAVQKSATWRIGSETKAGSSISYTPTRRYTSNGLLAYLTIVDSFNLSKNSANFYLTVLDPAISIQGGTSRTVSKGTSVPFALATQNSRDLDSVEWFVNNSSIGDGSARSYTFDEGGSFTIYAKGTSLPDIKGNKKELQSATQQITVVGEAPAVAIVQPSNVVEIVLGSSLNLRSETQADNSVQSTNWAYSGAASGSLGSSPTQATFTPTKAGEYTISLTVTDIHQKAGSASTRVLVLDPQIQVSTPQPNTTFALVGSVTPSVAATNAERILYFVNGKQVATSSITFADLGPGTHTFMARAFWDVVDQAGNPKEYSKDSSSVSFTVKDLQPPTVVISFPQDDMVLKTGEAYRLQAVLTSSSSVKESWWEVDGTRISSATYTPPTSSTKKALTITHNAMNQDGVKGSNTVQVRLANPAVYFTPPPTTPILASTVLATSATAVDAELYWLVDGAEIPNWDRTIATSGSHTLQAGWRMEAVNGSGRIATFTGVSTKVTLNIYSDKVPVITSFSPNTGIIHQKTGIPVIFAVQATSNNVLETTKWNIYSGDASIREVLAASISHQSWGPGLYTVRAQVRDAYNLSVTQEWTVKILDPKVTITYPQAGMSFALRQVPKAVVVSQDVTSYALSLNGQAITDQFDWNTLGVGQYTFSVVGSYAVTGNASMQNTAPQSVSFRVEDRTPPQFEVNPIKNNDRLVAGLRYNLIANVTANETISWLVNGTVVSTGPTYDFTPAATQKDLVLTVRGVRNSITVDKNFNLRVVDPYVSIVLPTDIAFNNLYPPKIAIPLRYESRDIDRVQWRVDMKPYTAQTVSFTQGMHSIALDGYATSVRLTDGTLGDYLPINTSGITDRDIQIADQQGVSSINAAEGVLEGKKITLEAIMLEQGDTDLIASLTYLVDGKVYQEGKRPANRSIDIPSLPPGTHTLSVRSADVFGNTREAQRTIRVYKPLVIAITSPKDGQRLSPDTNVLGSIQVLGGKEELITWRVDNQVVANSNFTTGTLGKLGPGTHTISASARDLLGNVVSSQVQVEVQSDFQLNLLQPAQSLEVVLGNPVACMVGVDKVVGSSINLSDAAQYISWYVNNQSTSVKGLSYQFPSDTAGRYTIQSRYANNGMERTTSERTITVRDIAPLVIKAPSNGQTITYSEGKTVALSASGEPGATLLWMNGEQVIAVGPETSFNPNGLTGNIQLTVVSKAFGRSLQKLVSINLIRNTPPSLTLSVPPVQYTGEALGWTATAFDVEDKNSNQAITYALDGIAIPSSGARQLVSNDVGTHTLVAITRDSMGEINTVSSTFRVVETKLPLEILSPQQGTTYFKGFEIPLIASLPGGEQGTYTWTVQYLDNASVGKETFTGSDAKFASKGNGNVEVTSVFVDANNRERARKSVSIDVKNEPLKLNINWPHGSMVNAGTALKPTLIGLPAQTSEANVSWFLNGSAVPSITALKAPELSGSYTLSAVYQFDGESEQAEVSFTVNSRPTVTITSIAQGKAYQTGEPLILSAIVEDDRPFKGTVIWKTDDGTVIGMGNPVIFTPPIAKMQTITAEATDAQQLSSSAKAAVQFYDSIRSFEANVNNGLPTYLVAATSAPLILKASFTGGRNPQVTWKMKQGNRVLEKTGKETSLVFAEVGQLLREAAVVTMTLTDTPNGEESSVEILSKDFPILFTSDATLQVISPASDAIQRVGQSVTLEVAMTGFANPALNLSINGALQTVNWEIGEAVRKASVLLQAGLFVKEGVYEVVASAQENGVQRSSATSLNLYASRKGVFIEGAPPQFDLSGEPVQISATLSDLPTVDKVQWKSDLSGDPIATGSTLDLSKAGLRAGDRSITVEAYAGSTLEASSSILLKVLDRISVQIEGDEAPLILQKGAQVSLTAKGFDRDGKALDSTAFRWSSHLDGVLGTGNTLLFENLPNISTGEHILTVQGIGQDGSTGTALKAVQVNALPQQLTSGDNTGSGQTPQDDQESLGTPGPGGPPAPPDYFGMGQPIDPFMPPDYPDPFGMGGGPPDPGLGNQMGPFFGGGGGMPGFGM